MTKAFETNQGPKQECRDLIVKHSKQLNPKTIFTLPAKQGLCVKTFKKHLKPSTIIGVERDEKDFKIIQDTLNMQCYKSDIRQYVYSQTLKTNHHDVVFLDYFSFLNMNVIGDINAFINNDNILHPKKQFILAITLAKSMRGQTEDMLNYMSKVIVDGNQRNADNSLEDVEEALLSVLIDSHSNLGIECLVKKEYKAQQQSMPMYFLMFLLTK